MAPPPVALASHESTAENVCAFMIGHPFIVDMFCTKNDMSRCALAVQGRSSLHDDPSLMKVMRP